MKKMILLVFTIVSFLSLHPMESDITNDNSSNDPRIDSLQNYCLQTLANAFLMPENLQLYLNNPDYIEALNYPSEFLQQIAKIILSKEKKETLKQPLEIKPEDNTTRLRLTTVTFSPDEKYFAYGTSTNKVSIYSIENGIPIFSQELSDQENTITDIAFSPNNKFFATASQNGSVHLYTYQKNKFEAFKTLTHKYSINSIIFSPEDNYLATASENGFVYIYSLNDFDPQGNPKKIQQFNDHNEDWSPYMYLVNTLAFSPDGSYFATASNEGLIILYLFDQEKKEYLLKQKFKNHNFCINKITFSLNGKFFASAGNDAFINLYTFKNGEFKLIKKIKPQIKANAIAFSPDSNFFGYGNKCNVNLDCLFEDKPELFQALENHDGNVLSLAMSTNYLVSSSENGTIKLYNYSSQAINIARLLIETANKNNQTLEQLNQKTVVKND